MKKSTKFLLATSIISSMAALSMHLYNKVIDLSATALKIFQKNRKKTFHWKLGDISYSVHGSGSPVLLLHDIHPCYSSFEWNSLIDVLSQNNTVFAFDLLGCGSSSRPKITYTNYVYVQLLNDFISSVIKEKTDIITSGLSGSLAVMVAKNDTSLIDKIIMINPHDLAELSKLPSFTSRCMKKIIELPVIGTYIYNLKMSQENVDSLLMNALSDNSKYQNKELADSFYESCHLAHGSGKYLYASLKANFINTNITHAMKELKNPMYILQGEQTAKAQESTVLYQSINRNVVYEILSRTKYFSHLEQPDIMVTKLLSCLDN